MRLNKKKPLQKTTSNTFVLMLDEIVKRSAPLPKKCKLMVLGAGFTGSHLVKAAKALGSKVIYTRRSPQPSESCIIFDSKSHKIPATQDLEDITHLLSCIPPTEEGEDPVIKSLGPALKNIPLKWVGYLSTTGVYGDYKGRWVSEGDLLKPEQLRSKIRLACEKAWQEMDIPVQILRLPGIYGPGRSAIETVKSGKTKMVDKSGQVFSRIHIDDIAGAIIHLINLSEKGIKPNVINIADNEPCANIEVLRYAGKLLNKKLPDIIPFEIAAQNMSPMALSFWKENRRVNNDQLCKELGYSLIHPNYKSGLEDCLKNHL